MTCAGGDISVGGSIEADGAAADDSIGGGAGGTVVLIAGSGSVALRLPRTTPGVSIQGTVSTARRTFMCPPLVARRRAAMRSRVPRLVVGGALWRYVA